MSRIQAPTPLRGTRFSAIAARKTNQCPRWSAPRTTRAISAMTSFRCLTRTSLTFEGPPKPHDGRLPVPSADCGHTRLKVVYPLRGRPVGTPLQGGMDGKIWSHLGVGRRSGADDGGTGIG